MASILPEQKERTIADLKPYFHTVMAAWIDSLHLDENKPLEWKMSRGIVRDPDKEVERKWAEVEGEWAEVEGERAYWKPGIDFTITIKDGETAYTQTFLQTENGWKGEETV